MYTLANITNKLHDVRLKSSQKLIRALPLHQYNLGANDQNIINDLYTNGVHVTSVEQLFKGDSQAIMDVLAKAATDLEASDGDIMPSYLQKKTSSFDMIQSYLLSKYPELFFLGLSEKILSLVETYIGMPAAYHGVALRRSLTDGVQAGPRVWHKDAEDFRVFRMVIYLNDVSNGGGPFEYIPRFYGLSYKAFRGIESNITAETMLKVVPLDLPQQVYGKAGTVIICDTANTFHHEKLQVTQRRSVAMFGFASRIPKDITLSKSHFPAEDLKDQLTPLLTPNQHPYVYGWR